MPSNHLILCRPLLLPSIFPSIKVPSNESVLCLRWPKNYWVSASTWVLPMNIQDWFLSGLTGWISLQSRGVSRVFSNTVVQKHQFFSTQLSIWSNFHIHIWRMEITFSSVQLLSNVRLFMTQGSNLCLLHCKWILYHWLTREAPVTSPDSILKSKDTTLSTKIHIIKAMVFPVVMYQCERWTMKKAECWRIDAFELWCWKRLLKVLGQQGDQTS